MTIKSSLNPFLVTNEAIRSTILIPFFGLACLATIYLLDINQSFFLSFNTVSHFTGESLWAGLTLFGDPIILLCLALALHTVAAQFSFAILPTLVIGGSTVMFLKSFFAVVRPPGVLQDIVIIGSPPISGAFPSGHATGAFAFATLLMLLTPNRAFKLLIFTVALLVGTSRIAVGAHWPLDVSGGIIIGWVCAMLGVQVSKNWQSSVNKTKLINILLLISSVYLLFRNTGYTQVQFIQYAIAISCIAIAAISLLKVKATREK